jgi:hypothetical protein
MNQFNIGDKVMVKKDCIWTGHAGEVATIVDIKYEVMCNIIFDGDKNHSVYGFGSALIEHYYDNFEVEL